MTIRTRLTGFTAAALLAAFLATAPAQGANGLIGEYRNKFNQLDTDPFGGTPVWSRVDAQLDLSWTNAPAPGIGANWFTVRWTGSLEPPASGGYVLRTIPDQACRLILDGSVLIEGWQYRKGTTSDTAVVTLDAARRYELIVEYQRTQNGVPYMHLQWQRPGTSIWEFVSNLYLYTDLPENALAVNHVRFFPRAGYASRMTNGRFTGSLQGETFGFSTIGTITATPPNGQWTDLYFTNNVVYRWIKYEAPAGSYGNVAELQFYHNNTLLSGVAFGTVSPSTNDFTKAFDSDTNTYFDSTIADNQYAGYDLGADTQVATPVFTPLPGGYGDDVIVSVSTATSNSYIKYTSNGSTPTWSNSLTYSGPFLLTATKTIVAKAFKPGMADSSNAQGTYTISQEPLKTGLRTYSTGNSLSDTTRSFPALAQSAGYDHKRFEFSIPGAPTDWLWTHPASGNNYYTNQAVVYAPVHYYTQQPFAGHGRTVSNENAYGGNFFALFQSNSPNMRWLHYQQWPDPSNLAGDRWSRAAWNTDPAQGEYELIQRGLTNAAKTYQQALTNHLNYFETLRKASQAKFPWKKVRIIPSGMALSALKSMVDAGQIPGQVDFAAETYGDGIHMSNKGAYLVDLTWFVAFYEENPVGKAFLANTELSAEQTRIYQQLAWDIVSEYRWSPFPWRRVLAGWETLGLSGNEAGAPLTTNDAQITASGWSRGPGLSAVIEPAGNCLAATGADASSLTNAVAGNDYFTMAIAPQAGFSMTLMEVIANIFSASGGVSATVLTSATGFTPSNAFGLAALPAGQTTNCVFDLTRDLRVRGLTDSVELRLYVWGQAAGDRCALGIAGAGNRTNELDVMLRGSVRETVPPSVPAGLITGTVTLTEVNLRWSPASDNVGVAGYNIYKNGVWLDATTTTQYRNADLSIGPSITYTVTAFDDEMNESAPSEPITVVPEPAAAVTLGIAGVLRWRSVRRGSGE